MSRPGMGGSHSQQPFFIGWSRHVPAELRRFYAIVGLVLLVGLAALGALLGHEVEDPAARLLSFAPAVASRPEPWLGDQVLTGTVTLSPFPILHVDAGTSPLAGRSVLLAGDGKRGTDRSAIVGRVAQGGAAEMAGAVLMRGDVPMLVVDGEPRAPARPAASRAVTAQPLGRWRIAGEICDGKCYTGAMRPGTGLAHRACANLCLDGDIPALFVAAAPVAGRDVLVLAAPDGGPPEAGLRGLTALAVELEGEVERLGDILVFRPDLARARRL